MLVRVAVAFVVGVQLPAPSTAAYFTVAVVAERSVAKLTATWLPTRSVRYGARVSCGANGAVAPAGDPASTTAATLVPSTAAASAARPRGRSERRGRKVFMAGTGPLRTFR